MAKLVRTSAGIELERSPAVETDEAELFALYASGAPALVYWRAL